MMILARMSVVCAAALTVLALPACQSEKKAEPASTSTSSSAAATSSAATSASATTSAPATTSASAPASGAAKPTGEKVGPADLPGVVSDRTHRGSDSGKAYSEYYAPDGTLRGKSDTESYTGSWKAVGEQLCFDYSYADTSKNYNECYDVFNNGDMIQWVDANGVQQETVFVPGNPDGL